jgi:histone H3
VTTASFTHIIGKLKLKNAVLGLPTGGRYFALLSQTESRAHLPCYPYTDDQLANNDIKDLQSFQALANKHQALLTSKVYNTKLPFFSHMLFITHNGVTTLPHLNDKRFITSDADFIKRTGYGVDELSQSLTLNLDRIHKVFPVRRGDTEITDEYLRQHGAGNATEIPDKDKVVATISHDPFPIIHLKHAMVSGAAKRKVTTPHVIYPSVSTQQSGKHVVRQPQQRRRRAKPGVHALREIRRYQSTTNLLIPRRPFRRLIVEVMQQFHPDLRLQSSAALALQEASEAYLTQFFEMSQLASLHAGRLTIMVKDESLVRRIQSR